MAPKKTQEYDDLKKTLDDIQETLRSFMDQVSAKLTPLWEMMEEFRRFRAQNEQRENRVDILEKRLDDVEQQELTPLRAHLVAVCHPYLAQQCCRQDPPVSFSGRRKNPGFHLCLLSNSQL